ncbi:THUMP domain-containing class I SAM-dependent RNA methyltransferase [Thermosipho atlanticus]|uniref:Putative N6-adenine-specific DNA methylase n=1 Tax=Thermosipho atlanticus DSM 15807 TaxID=1123380 RepID=A0A1M5RYG7_9BACT|nr:THUMP domain-containing protein [Thermosipho atlanticus]SHH31224.1 putative N6-adenine-specific DNA methylase [Thermosipho atlanticus DSM 15807]
MKILLTCTAGLEAATALEIRRMGYKIIESTSGRLFIEAAIRDIPKLNLWLRTAERVYIVLNEKKVESFDELFDVIYEIDWNKFIDDGKILISDVTVRNSKLSAKGAITSVATAAIWKRIKRKIYRSENIFPIRLILKNDVLLVLLDTTGRKALSKRGYRLKTSKAPIRETIAAAMLLLSRWDGTVPLIDPFCGSGTILIEAALYSLKIPPGINRKFVSENWEFLYKYWLSERNKLNNLYNLTEYQQKIIGFDIDSKVIEVAKENSKKLNLIFLDFQVRDFNNIEPIDRKVYIITNPPYGERLKSNVELKDIWEKFPKANVYILSPDNKFEKKVGRKARKKIRFQNSGIWVWYYMFY